MSESLMRETEAARRRFRFWKKLTEKASLALLILATPFVLGLTGLFSGAAGHLLGVFVGLFVGWVAMLIYYFVLLHRLEKAIQLERRRIRQYRG